MRPSGRTAGPCSPGSAHLGAIPDLGATSLTDPSDAATVVTVVSGEASSPPLPLARRAVLEVALVAVDALGPGFVQLSSPSLIEVRARKPRI